MLSLADDVQFVYRLVLGSISVVFAALGVDLIFFPQLGRAWSWPASEVTCSDLFRFVILVMKGAEIMVPGPSSLNFCLWPVGCM